MWHKIRTCWKNGADRLAQCPVAINLHFLKTAISVKHDTPLGMPVLE